MWQHDFLMKQIFFGSIFMSENTGRLANQAGYPGHDPWHTRYLCSTRCARDGDPHPQKYWISDIFVASLALTKQSKTPKFKERALAGKRNPYASGHSLSCRRVFSHVCWWDRLFYKQNINFISNWLQLTKIIEARIPCTHGSNSDLSQPQLQSPEWCFWSSHYKIVLLWHTKKW